MKVKIFTSRFASEVQEQINDFISDKHVVDVQVAGGQNEYGEFVYQYVIIYMED